MQLFTVHEIGNYHSSDDVELIKLLDSELFAISQKLGGLKFYISFFVYFCSNKPYDFVVQLL